MCGLQDNPELSHNEAQDDIWYKFLQTIDSHGHNRYNQLVLTVYEVIEWNLHSLLSA
ncbi:hypothetical protein Pelsub_P2900 [Pelolinea submarina]|nr:hypothetical protein Pelsub_P2900 [Pelolinea submarina]